MKTFNIIFSVIIFFILLDCCNQPKTFSLQTGDILFRGSLHSSLSRAIDEVTQTANETHYTHMGIVVKENDTVWVYHAAPKKGVAKETLGQFKGARIDSLLVVAYRFKKEYQHLLPKAVVKARNLVGEPYNYSYVLEDEGFYCSEYVYQLFVTDSIFKLNPMTFKDTSGIFHSGWVKHYQDLGMEIPEGKPGCNPNGMAANDKLIILGALNPNNQ
ncbi:hypothetical protein DMA11_04815 [Marinilabiliaceae bacterium JC017]|nr:hypothetical protein DMA11_04815 [Marinilabiliaceae bacterium JC017]